LVTTGPGRTAILYLTLFKEMGGGEYAVYNLLKGLDRSRFRPVIVFNGNGPFVEKVRELGVEVEILDYPVVMIRDLVRPAVLWRTIRSSFGLHKFIMRQKIDIVHCTDVLSLLLLVRAAVTGRIRILYNVIFFHEWSRMVMFNLLALFFVDRIVTNSRAIRTDLLRRTAGLELKTVTIYYGIDLERFRPRQQGTVNILREEFGIPGEVKIVGMIARYDRWKGHFTFLEAAGRLFKTRRDVRFVIVGGLLNADILTPLRAYYDEVQRYRVTLGLEEGVVMIPHRDDIPAILTSLDVFVCPSVREPIPLIVFEAMASGVPVVAADSGGIPEQIDHGVDGYLFRTGDAGALAGAVGRCLDEPTGPMTKAAREKVEREFTLGRYVREIESIYGRL